MDLSSKKVTLEPKFSVTVRLFVFINNLYFEILTVDLLEQINEKLDTIKTAIIHARYKVIRKDDENYKDESFMGYDIVITEYETIINCFIALIWCIPLTL